MPFPAALPRKNCRGMDCTEKTKRDANCLSAGLPDIRLGNCAGLLAARARIPNPSAVYPEFHQRVFAAFSLRCWRMPKRTVNRHTTTHRYARICLPAPYRPRKRRKNRQAVNPSLLYRKHRGEKNTGERAVERQNFLFLPKTISRIKRRSLHARHINKAVSVARIVCVAALRLSGEQLAAVYRQIRRNRKRLDGFVQALRV